MLFWCLARSGIAARSAVLIRAGELGPIGVVLHRIFDPILSQPGAQHELGALHAPLADRRLRAKLNKLGIPSPEPLRGGFSRWRDFLRILHGCVIQGDVKKAKGLLERLEAADQKRAADGNKAESDAPPGDVVGG